MRTQLPDARTTPRFAGIPTFLRYPRLEDVPASATPVDWALYGAPFDGGVSFRPGARFGPRAVRDASQYIKRFSIEHDVDVCEVLSLADAGDAPTNPYSCEATKDLQLAFARTLGDPAHTRLFMVGGDHSTAYANMRATWERHGSPEGGLPMIHFDSHVDTIDELWGEKWGHASPIIRAAQDGVIDGSRSLSVGVKGPLNTRADLDEARALGIDIVTMPEYEAEIAEAGRGRIGAFLKALGNEPCYLTFDIDVMDPVFAPGTGTPAVGGFTSSQMLSLLRSLAGVNIAGADLVEVLPDRDSSQITALLAGQIIFEILALDARRRARA